MGICYAVSALAQEVYIHLHYFIEFNAVCFNRFCWHSCFNRVKNARVSGCLSVGAGHGTWTGKYFKQSLSVVFESLQPNAAAISWVDSAAHISRKCLGEIRFVRGISLNLLHFISLWNLTDSSACYTVETRLHQVIGLRERWSYWRGTHTAYIMLMKCLRMHYANEVLMHKMCWCFG